MDTLFSIIIMVLGGLLSIVVGLLSWVFLDTRKRFEKRQEEQDNRIHILENEKFDEIRTMLLEIKRDIAVLQTEVKNLKESK